MKFYARAVSGVDMKDLKSLADEAKQSVGSGVAAIAASSEDGKASIVVAVTPDLTSRFNAVELVRLGSAALGGKGGGGRPDMAQAGGPDGREDARSAGRGRRGRAPGGPRLNLVDALGSNSATRGPKGVRKDAEGL